MNGKIRKVPLILGSGLALAAVVLLLLVLFQNELFPESSPAHRGGEVAVSAGCASCHGSGGSASVNPARTGPPEVVPPLFSERLSPEELRQWIRNGVSDARASSEAFVQARTRKILEMPAYGDRLTAAEIDDLTAWVALHQYGRHAAEKGSQSDGEAIARKFACFTCHGELGQGGVENPGSLKGYIPGFFGSDFRALTRNGDRSDIREWIVDGHSRYFWDHGFAGFHPGQYFTERQVIRMPAYRELITGEELAHLTDFLIELMELGPLSAEKLVEYRPLRAPEADGEPDPERLSLGEGSPAGFSPVAAVLESHCLECHGPEKQKSGYRLDYQGAAFKGGDIAFFGGKPAIEPGDSAGSLLFEFVTAQKEVPMEEIYPMPPKDRSRLTREEIEILRNWIESGAAWPEGLILGRPE